MKGDEKVNKEYEYLQKEIHKLLLETSERKTHKNYQEMKTSDEYKSSLKKIGKLVMRLEKLEEEDRKDNRRKINT